LRKIRGVDWERRECGQNNETAKEKGEEPNMDIRPRQPKKNATQVTPLLKTKLFPQIQQKRNKKGNYAVFPG